MNGKYIDVRALQILGISMNPTVAFPRIQAMDPSRPVWCVPKPAACRIIELSGNPKVLRATCRLFRLLVSGTHLLGRHCYVDGSTALKEKEKALNFCTRNKIRVMVSTLMEAHDRDALIRCCKLMRVDYFTNYILNGYEAGIGRGWLDEVERIETHLGDLEKLGEDTHAVSSLFPWMGYRKPVEIFLRISSDAWEMKMVGTHLAGLQLYPKILGSVGSIEVGNYSDDIAQALGSQLGVGYIDKLEALQIKNITCERIKPLNSSSLQSLSITGSRGLKLLRKEFLPNLRQLELVGVTGDLGFLPQFERLEVLKIRQPEGWFSLPELRNLRYLELEGLEEPVNVSNQPWLSTVRVRNSGAVMVTMQNNPWLSTVSCEGFEGEINLIRAGELPLIGEHKHSN